METPQIQPDKEKPLPRDVTLSDGGEGVIVGKVAYKKLADGVRVKLGTIDEDGKIISDEEKEGKKS